MDTPSELKIPDLVNRALNLAEQMEYSGECSHEVGSLLQVFVGTNHVIRNDRRERVSHCGGKTFSRAILEHTRYHWAVENTIEGMEI